MRDRVPYHILCGAREIARSVGVGRKARIDGTVEEIAEAFERTVIS